MNKEYYSVKEFAELTGTTQQAVYKRMKAGLKNYVITIDGKKMISAAGLVSTVETTGKTTVDKPVENTEKSTVQDTPPATENNRVVEPVEKPSSDNALLEILNKQVDILSRQLETKDKQIEALNERLAEAFKTIDNQNLLINQQQHLALLDKTGGKVPEKESDNETINSVVDVEDPRETENNTGESLDQNEEKKDVEMLEEEKIVENLEPEKEIKKTNTEEKPKKKGLFERIFG